MAGHLGLVGAALARRLDREGFTNILTATRKQLDLRNQGSVAKWFRANRPDYVCLAAGTVGGILANSQRPADFIYDNLAIAINVVHAAHEVGTKKLVYLSSSSIYPREAPQPMAEDRLLTGRLEPTNEPYAVAKIAGIKLCQAYRRQHGCDFISATPTNLYGPGDNFDPESGHVLAGLIRRFHEARKHGENVVKVWGTGAPKRDFLHVDDLAAACLLLMNHYGEAEHVNIGTGQDTSIRDLALIVRDVVHPEGAIEFDPSRPDGVPRKLLDVSRLSQLGWQPAISLREGIRETYDWFLEHQSVSQ